MMKSLNQINKVDYFDAHNQTIIFKEIIYKNVYDYNPKDYLYLE